MKVSNLFARIAPFSGHIQDYHPGQLMWIQSLQMKSDQQEGQNEREDYVD